jgi:protein TonB
MALSKFDGWAGYSGGDKLIQAGDELPDDHALVVERPELFEVEPEPEPDPPVVERPELFEVEPEPEPDPPVVEPVAAPRAKPGPKLKRPA